jgi:hypothetical protein
MHWISLHNGFMKQVFENMFEICAQTDKDYFIFEGKKISIAGKTLEQFTDDHNKSEQPGMVMLQLETAMKLVTLRLQNDAIMVCRLGNEDAEFITSDNPVIATNSKVDRIMPFDWENTLRLPLDTKHELLLIPNGEKETMNQVFRNELSGDHCENENLVVNYLQMSMAETFMFGTKSGLKSYLATKEETERKIKAG